MAWGQIVLWPVAAVGVFALAMAALLAQPVKAPPPLESIHSGAMEIPQDGKPDLSRFQARDGTWLAYRLYPTVDGARDRLAVVYHGSTASSDEMNATALALAKAGFVAVAVDARGHGASGSRGDISYVGQLEDDLADLVAHLRADYTTAHLTLVGHSSGGGFVLRAAAAPVGASFDRFVLLAPYLGYRAPTNRPSVGPGGWAAPDLPRIAALTILGALGIDWAQALPAIAFANRPEAAMATTSRYSYRLLINYGPPHDWEGALRSAAGKIELIAGLDDELMDAEAYKRVAAPLGVRVTLLPGVNHMGVVYQPAALAAIAAAVK